MRRIGILGGMGPEATVLLMERVIEAVPARDDSDHVPLIVDQNPQVPSRIARLIEGRGDDPGPVLADMARRLEAAGAKALAMPCNTAHHFAAAIRGAVAIPFLDMIALSARRALELAPANGRVGILGSPAIRKTALFEPALSEHGLTAIYPAHEDSLLSAIREIKSAGPTPRAGAAVRAASAELLEAGAELQFVACTEFSLLADCAAPGARCVDTLDILVRAIVATATDTVEKDTQGSTRTQISRGMAS